MIKSTTFMTTCFALLGMTTQTAAVSLNSNGHGQALIYPYYTVRNGLNTIYNVINTSAQAKAIKIRFLEGDAGMEAFEFNVYLGPHDVWNGALVPTQSTYAGHVGEESTLHVTDDQSCAPFVNKAGQEFVPFVIDQDAPNNNLERVTSGHMVVIEMGVLTGNSALSASHFSGVPANCQALQEAWESGGYWYFNPDTDLDEPTGELVGNATLINVTDGIGYSYAAVALDDFWQGAGLHGEPGSLYPSLNEAHAQSEVIIDGQIQVSEWATGIEAVSATLMRSSLINQFAIDSESNIRTEWVITYPTKSFHVNSPPSTIQPFRWSWSGDRACEYFGISYWDRNTINIVPHNGSISPRPPQGYNPRFCHTTNAFQFIDDFDDYGLYSHILDTNNFVTVLEDHAYVIDNGWVEIQLNSDGENMTPLSGVGYEGFPVVGFALERVTNVQAQPGLIAQYGRLFEHTYQISSFDSNQRGGQHE